MKEIRLSNVNAETRSEGENANELVLRGCPIVYDQPTIINDGIGGNYTEIIKRGALDGADLSDVRLLYNHDANKIPLARTPKTMQLNVDTAGLTFEAVLPNTEEARAVHIAVQRGDLSGASFAFTVPDGGDVFDPVTNTRTILKIKKVYEFSICPFPAYPQTSLEARSVQAVANKRFEQIRRAKIIINEILMKK